MNKKILAIVIGAAVVATGAYIFLGQQRKVSAPTVVFDPGNATYSIDGQSVTLINGGNQTPAAPGSAEEVVTKIFGGPVSGDLNGDGVPDAAVMLVQDPGGSGTFYYIAVAINAPGGAQGSNAILLGDRIAPQNIEIKDGQIVANYADRKAGESMATPPSVGISKYFIYESSTLRSIVLSGAH
jgi:hypothetical protein